MMEDRYYRFSDYLRKKYGQRVQKITIDAGFSCPNRDGTLSDAGCIFCDNQAFNVQTRSKRLPIREQIEQGIKSAYERFKAKKYMIYFQAFTNTYAAVSELKKIYDHVKEYEDIVAIAIGTRPDCIDGEKLALINQYTEDKEVWIEYGLQTINDMTLQTINRGHGLKEFLNAVALTRDYPNIKICVHAILGLPGETEEDNVKTACMLCDLGIEAIKIHPLHVVRNTKLEELFLHKQYVPLSLEEYILLVIAFLERTSSKTVIQRLTAECPPDLLIAPDWINEKGRIIGEIERHLVDMNTFQGKLVGI